jgi:hypothetical protein
LGFLLGFLAAKDAGFRSRAQWIISRYQALTGHPSEEGAMPELAISAEKSDF